MNQVDAYRLLDEKIRTWKAFEFSQLKQLAGDTVTERIEVSGQQYLIESRVIPDQSHQAIHIDLMVATADSGPLRRIDRTIAIESD